jgi:hypothetical protein
MVEATGGQTITGVSAGEAFLTAIRTIQLAPAAAIAVPGAEFGASSIVVDASASVDFSGCGIILYEWDWDGDGTYDESSVIPTLVHDYGDAGFPGTVRVRVTDATGRTGTTAFVLEVIPTVTEVTSLLTDLAVTWALDRQTGHLVGTITIGPREAPLSGTMWVALSGLDFTLEESDGETPDGRPYVDLTAEFLAAVRLVGDNDGVLDPDESVTFSPARLYSASRSAPPSTVLGFFSNTSGFDVEPPPDEEEEDFAPLSGTLSPSAIVNLSARVAHGPADRAAMPGFVITGEGTRRVLVRAVGPGLAAWDVEGALADPALRLYRLGGSGPVSLAANADWGTGGEAVAAAAASAGAFPLVAGSSDAALVADLAPGAYSAVVESAGEGVTLVEVYGLAEGAATTRLANVSARAYVGTGDRVAIAGLVVNGEAPRRFLVRAVGPTLARPPYNVPGTLANPVVTIQGSSGAVASNSGWSAENALVEAANAAGAFPLAVDADDAALVVTLPPGAYSVVVMGEGGTEGVALVEVYALD